MNTGDLVQVSDTAIAPFNASSAAFRGYFGEYLGTLRTSGQDVAVVRIMFTPDEASVRNPGESYFRPADLIVA